MSAWRFGSYDLASFGNVTQIDDYLDLPDSRGNNQVIPFRHGTRFVRKYFDERVLSFGIAVYGDTADDVEAKMETLRSVLAVRTEQTLTQYLTDGSSRTAQASVDRPLQVNRKAPNIALITVEFTLASPYMRSSSLIADNTTTINASPKAMTVTNPGTVEERDPIITLTGPLQNTVITNSTNGCVLTYTGTIASPRVVTIQTSANGDYTATTDLGASVIGTITHSGSAALMVLNAGVNTLSITDATATTGTVKISFYPPYL
jgi:phage-related protein